jgi:DNA-binding winged helix-turn-helix (wHTH) protein/TolB-like protein/tetratricopeptide (TPR) repeat protein
MSEPSSPQGKLRFGEFTLDVASAELWRGGTVQPLQAHAFQVLALLTAHPGELITRERLIARLWPRTTYIDTDAGLNTAVKRLRTALGDDADQPRYIETLPRRGYRFAAPVEIEAEVGTTAANVDAATKGGAEVASKTRNAWKLLGVAAALALAAGAALLGWHHQPEPWSSTDPRMSNVILSAENLSGDPALDQIARQFTDAAMWNVSDIYVMSAVTYAVEHPTQLSDAELREIGKKFDSHFIIVYALRKEGDGIAINATLVDARTGARVMTDSIVTNAYRTLAEQRIMSAGLAPRISFTELEIEAAEAERVRPNSLDARDLTNRAFLTDSIPQAIEDLNRARELEPDALAPLWISAQVRSEAVAKGESADPAADTKRALAEIDRVFQYRPSNAVIAGARAYILNNLGLLDEAWNAYDRVHDIVPGEPFAHLGKARIALRRGQLDLAQTELEGMKGWRQREKIYLGAMIAFARGDYEAAAHSEERAIAMYGEAIPFVKYSKLAQASAFYWLGREADAKAKLASALAPQPGPDWWPGTHLSELRAKRELFGLPDEAWDRLVLGLQGAGMAE